MYLTLQPHTTYDEDPFLYYTPSQFSQMYHLNNYPEAFKCFGTCFALDSILFIYTPNNRDDDELISLRRCLTSSRNHCCRDSLLLYLSFNILTQHPTPYCVAKAVERYIHDLNKSYRRHQFCYLKMSPKNTKLKQVCMYTE